jgi:drug/metabolite transporter (DMT)-like permease
MKQKTIGIIAVLFAALMWAMEPVITKLAYRGSGFVQTSMIRAFVITLFTFLLIVIARKPLIIRDKQTFTALGYIALMGTLVADLIYYYAIGVVPVVNAVLLGHLQPVFIILIGYVILKKDSIQGSDYLGILFLMMSAMFVTTKTIDNLVQFNFGSIGDVLVLFATITWATTALVTRKYLIHLDAATITLYRFAFASFVFVFLIPFIDLSLNIYQILVGLIVACGTIGYYAGLRRLKAAHVSGIELAAPVFAAAIGYFILKEHITLLQILGMVLLFIGIYCLSKKEVTPLKNHLEERIS